MGESEIGSCSCVFEWYVVDEVKGRGGHLSEIIR
jgi:hypothetical protein